MESFMTSTSTPFQTIDIWSNPKSPDIWSNSKSSGIWSNPKSPDIWSKSKSSSDIVSAFDLPSSMVTSTSNIIPSAVVKKTPVVKPTQKNHDSSISAGTSTIRKYLSTPDNILKLVIAILVIFVIGFGIHFYLKKKLTYNPNEITSSCKTKIHEYCTKGTTYHNAQEVPVLSLFNGDVTKCETESKLFHDRPLECQPNNKEILCNKIEEIAAQSNPELAKVYKKNCDEKKNIKLNPQMGKCLEKDFDDLDELNDCLLMNKNHSVVGYDYQEFFPQKIKW